MGMDIQLEMQVKRDLIRGAEMIRNRLFVSPVENEGRIRELFFEIEVMQLEYLLLKRKQLSELKSKTDVSSIECVNENSIKLARQNLLDEGQTERLARKMLLEE